MPFVTGRAVPVIVPVMVFSLLAGQAVVAQLDGGPPLFSYVGGTGPVLIHYWNFDTIPNDVDFSKTGKELLDAASRRYGAFLSYSGGRWDRVNDPTSINAREAPYDPALDRALRLRNPMGALTIDLPTTGYRDVQLRYVVNRTANGAERQQIAYSLDGGKTFTTAGLSTAEIAVMGPEGAVNIIYRRELAASRNVEKQRQEKVQEFREKFANPYIAAERGFIDEVIEPRFTRRKLISALRMLDTKRDTNPSKKHGNIPL